MSEPIPESIPTSADPRSKRPVKKRLVNNNKATCQNASQIDALFAKPEQAIHIPGSATKQAQSLSAPPEIVQNVQGSSAGAGSGEFHVYKASRRREFERMRRMDEEVREEEERGTFDKEKRDREERDNEKTRKNREKRERKLGNKKAARGEGTKKGSADGKRNDFERKGGMKANPSLAGVQSGSKNQDEEGTTAVADQQAGLVIHDDDD